MDLQTRKLELVKLFLNLQNKDLINRIEDVLIYEISMDYEQGNTIKSGDWNKRIDQSLEDSENGNLTEVSVLIEEIGKWNYVKNSALTAINFILSSFHKKKRLLQVSLVFFSNQPKANRKQSIYFAGFLGLIIIIIRLPSSLGSWSTLPTCSSSWASFSNRISP